MPKCRLEEFLAGVLGRFEFEYDFEKLLVYLERDP